MSLALNHPVLRGALQGYPHDREALDRLVGSWLGRAYGRLPSAVRLRIMRGLPVEVSTLGVFAGPPSVAHAEALLRATEARGVRLEEPSTRSASASPTRRSGCRASGRTRCSRRALGLGYALRLWRDRFPVAEGGTAILVHRLHRRYAHPGQQPYRAFFAALRDANGGGGPGGGRGGGRRTTSARSRRTGAATRATRCSRMSTGAAAHRRSTGSAPCWSPGSRDASVARTLGFVPTHGLRAALAMAEGRADRPLRLAVLPSPPYPPLTVGS